MSLSPHILRRIKGIEMRTRRLVHGAFAGVYQSVYKGKGMTFASVRPYTHGDDVRAIDWKVTARSGEPFIKEFVEERELTVMLLIDGSASVLFGTQDVPKRDFMAELGAILAYCATFNNDRLGLMIFSEHIEHHLPPRKGRNHIMRLISDLLTFETQHKGTDLALALRTAQRVLPSGSIVFVISDFLAPPASYQQALQMLSMRHDVISVVVNDILEEQFPQVGMIGLQDSETSSVQWIDTQSKAWQAGFQQQQQDIANTRHQFFAKANIKHLLLPTHSDPIHALRHFFQAELRRQRR
jgi:uncharacterized protein (DUF58 family)